MPRRTRTRLISQRKVRTDGGRSPQTDVPPDDQLARLAESEFGGR